MLTAQERWERIAGGLLWTGVIFMALSAYGIYSGDDWRGVTMTIAPGALCLALWQLISLRLDGIVRGDRGGRVRQIASMIVVAIGAVALVAAFVLGRERHPQPQSQTVYIPDDLVICDIPGPNGTRIESLARKADCLPATGTDVSR